jgi:CRISPR system Cascade subunit CasE
MFFSKIEVCGCRELMDWLKYKSFTSYTVHQLLWDLFPEEPDANRTFLFRQEQNTETRLPVLYVVSKDQPLRENGFLRIAGVKEYSPQLHVNQNLAFTARINPVVSRVTEGSKHSQKHDIWADAKKRGKADRLIGVELSEFIEDEAKNWLVSRAEKFGFSLDRANITLEGYRTHCFQKTSRGRKIRYGTLDYKGILCVADKELFKMTLFNGIGRSKAFGCGLMMVKRVG